MRRSTGSVCGTLRYLQSILLGFTVIACAAPTLSPSGSAGVTATTGGEPQLLLGRLMVVSHACGDCHGGGSDPANPNWLSGARTPEQEFKVGPFTTHARNITPDNTTGIGRFSERQIFNSLRFGLRPGETPDVEITSITPGQGNFPLRPKYLAPPMPWPSWRHMSDQELWAIAAYLKRGVKAVSHRVADSEGPPDFWASAYTVEKIGTYPMPPFPTATETRQP